MRRMRMPTRVKILIFTPEAMAEIHSPSGKNEKKMASTTMMATRMPNAMMICSIGVPPR